MTSHRGWQSAETWKRETVVRLKFSLKGKNLAAMEEDVTAMVQQWADQNTLATWDLELNVVPGAKNYAGQIDSWTADAIVTFPVLGVAEGS